MPINVFGNSSSSHDDGNKVDTSLIVQKPYFRTNCIEANIEEDFNMKNLFKKIYLVLKEIQVPFVNLRYTIFFNDPSILKNTEHIVLIDRYITDARFIQVNQWPQNDSRLTVKLYVDNSINEPSLVGNFQDNDFSYQNLSKINSTTSDTQAVNDNQVNTKAYVDQFHNDDERTRRDLGLDFYSESSGLVKNNQDNDLNDNKLTNLDSNTVNKNPDLDKELANEKYVDDSVREGNILRFNPTLENYLKVSVGNDTHNLTKFDKNQITDTTIIKNPNNGG